MMRLWLTLSSMLLCNTAWAQLGQTQQALAGAGTFARVADFGGNPGALNLFRYVPSPDPGPGAPLMVALHACSQNATAYRNAGWEPLADEYGFYVIYPEQNAANNPAGCFNWAGEFGNGANIPRGDGENQSIKNMVDFMLAEHDVDPDRVFAAGHSGGGAQSALMMATWPDVFAGGAMIAGIPYECTRSFNQVSACLNPGLPRSAQAWGDLVRNAFPAYAGAYPKISIWHGTNDFTVSPNNATELIKQWSNVHGVGIEPTRTEMIDGQQRQVWANDAGEAIMEYVAIQGGGHGTFVDPDNGCGTVGPFFEDQNICSSQRIAEFFGITDAAPPPGDRSPPTVQFTAPQADATVSDQVMLSADAMDDVGVVEVGFAVNGDAVGSAASPPWTVTWDASMVPAGSYTLTAIARDAAGNSGDAQISVTVQSDVVDDTPPSIALTAPMNGAEVSGSTRIEATAMDDNTVAKVSFFVDDAAIGEALSAPYGVAWDAAATGEGQHRVRATAVDAAGNEASAEAMVTVVAGPAPGVMPQVQLASPAEGSTVSGVAQITIAVTAPVPVSPVVLFWNSPDAGEVPIATDYRGPPFEFLWDVSMVPEGPQTLTARAFDDNGGVGTTQFSLVVSHSVVDGAGGMDGGEPELERRRAGRSYWGCWQGHDESSPAWWALFALVVMRRWRSR